MHTGPDQTMMNESLPYSHPPYIPVMAITNRPHQPILSHCPFSFSYAFTPFKHLGSHD